MRTFISILAILIALVTLYKILDRLTDIRDTLKEMQFRKLNNDPSEEYHFSEEAEDE